VSAHAGFSFYHLGWNGKTKIDSAKSSSSESTHCSYMSVCVPGQAEKKEVLQILYTLVTSFDVKNKLKRACKNPDGDDAAAFMKGLDHMMELTVKVKAKDDNEHVNARNRKSYDGSIESSGDSETE
jgi:hypothetical protein